MDFRGFPLGLFHVLTRCFPLSSMFVYSGTIAAERACHPNTKALDTTSNDFNDVLLMVPQPRTHIRPILGGSFAGIVPNCPTEMTAFKWPCRKQTCWWKFLGPPFLSRVCFFLYPCHFFSLEEFSMVLNVCNVCTWNVSSPVKADSLPQLS